MSGADTALLAPLGKVIRERRKALGLTLAQLSGMAEVSLGYISQIELGRNSPSIESLSRLSKSLDVKLSDLLSSAETGLPLATQLGEDDLRFNPRHPKAMELAKCVAFALRAFRNKVIFNMELDGKKMEGWHAWFRRAMKEAGYEDHEIPQGEEKS